MNRPDRGAAPGLLVVSNGHGEDAIAPDGVATPGLLVVSNGHGEDAIAPDGVATPGLLVVSNGHGEDAIGAALVRRLRHALPDLEVEALPLVGTGAAYEPELLVGPRRALPGGGLTLHHPRLLLQDVRAGILGLTIRQASFLARQRPGAVLVVGDAFAQLMASLVRAPRAVLQPLVSIEQERPIDAARLNRYFMESIRAPERFLLSRAQRVYTRDEATAAALRARGVSKATFVGNPIMDGLDAEPAFPRTAADGSVVIALLPGSRGYAYESVERMVGAIDELSALVEPTRSITALVPWTLPHRPGPYIGWSKRGTPARYCGGGSVVEAWEKDRTEVWWVEDGFASALAAADAVLGTSGTANEQAAGLGLPVVAFPVPPFYGRAFLENQERLLGGALRIVDTGTAAVALALREALDPGPHRRAAATVGPARLGGAGGTRAVASDLEAWLRDLSQ